MKKEDYDEVAHADDIPEGQSRIVTFKQKEVAIFNIGGEFFAIENTCPHMGGPLGEGFLDDETVTCPWHAWQFNVKTGEHKLNPSSKLKTFKVRLEGSKIFLGE